MFNYEKVFGSEIRIKKELLGKQLMTTDPHRNIISTSLTNGSNPLYRPTPTPLPPCFSIRIGTIRILRELT